MDSTGASVSLNGSCITVAAAADSSNNVPHYLRPSTGSCHDICKYGRRRPFEEQPTKPLHKTTANLSILVVPSHRRKETANGQPLPSSHTKSFSPRAKFHSPRLNISAYAPQVVKRGIKRAQVQGNGRNSIGSRMPKPKGCQPKKSVMVKLSSPRDSLDGVCGKRRRNEDVQSGENIQSSSMLGKKPLSFNTATSDEGKTATAELLSPRKDRMRVKRVKTDPFIPSTPSLSVQEEGDRGSKMPRTGTESNEFEFRFEAITDVPSSSSHGDEDEESDILASDTTVSQKNKSRNKRRRTNMGFQYGDKQNQPVKVKFRIGKVIHPHEECNALRRRKFRSSRVDKMRADDSISGSNNKSLRFGPPKPSRFKDKYCSSKNRRRRVRYGKTRILVLEDRKGDSKRNHHKEEGDVVVASLMLLRNNLNHQDHVARKKDVQCLFNNVIEETASKLAERRKGMVKSLVGAFETLISQQTRKCILQLRKMNG
ncbi:uncharacterized protein LOC130988731 [Salvia miltiorrhiza]|uniref:uncharacterized protein LOC130988731 n=1 Tax=Salvia miltiorrhiza TaxID=226208 RepID=UPI0025AC4163|nr:uncharacterized protein LOC130988731 [Salvia miltiorrhiza]XP_057768653.1 uncharacterized protein LOC130988731 [Salvia miltiorrhiza]